MEILVYLLLFCGLLVANWYIAKEFHAIAVAKGHPGKKYFWWSFWFGFYGYAMVIALPDRGNGQTAASAPAIPAVSVAPAAPMAPAAPVANPYYAASGTNAVSDLKKYKELLDMGIITQEEFERKKRQLMSL